MYNNNYLIKTSWDVVVMKENKKQLSASVLQTSVKWYFEIVSLNKDCSMYVNEEWILLDLEYNEIASNISWQDIVWDVVLSSKSPIKFISEDQSWKDL